jgi:hypothetical protein
MRLCRPKNTSQFETIHQAPLSLPPFVHLTSLTPRTNNNHISIRKGIQYSSSALYRQSDDPAHYIQPPNMAPSYEPVATHDEDDHVEGHIYMNDNTRIPDSPPPSFRSRASSPVFRQDPLRSDQDRELHDTFDSPSDDEGSDDGNNESDDRQRLMHGRAPTIDTPSTNTPVVVRPTATPPAPSNRIVRMVTQLPIFNRGQTYGAGNQNDGVFANLSAKPQRGDDVDEKPPVSMNPHIIPWLHLLIVTTDLRTSRRRRNTTLLGNHNPRPRHGLRRSLR